MGSQPQYEPFPIGCAFIRGFSSVSYPNEKPTNVPYAFIWFAQNFAYVTLLLLPVFSWASYLAFRKSGIHYLEHVVINAYITGQQAIFYSLFILLEVWLALPILELLAVLTAVAYAFWVFWQLFDQGHRLSNLLRSFLAYFLYLMASFCLLLGVMGGLSYYKEARPCTE